MIKSFLLTVVLPTLLTLVYYTLVASDIYVAEAKLSVREAYEPSYQDSLDSSNSVTSIIGKIGIGGGAATSQDSMIILDYLKSRSVIVDIGGKPKLRQVFGKASIDWFSRLDADDDLESIWAYWKKHVVTYVDSTSNILTLKVRGYTPDDAFWLARELTRQSEVLVNTISRRNREDALDTAAGEVNRAMAELATARADILSFQRRTKTIDPQDTAKQILSLVAELTVKKIELEGELKALQLSGAANKPGEKYRRINLDAINKQLDDLQKSLTSNDSSALSDHLKDYELLKLKEKFAEQLYTVARNSMEEARRKLTNQQLYVVVIVPPLIPDSSVYPKPLEQAAVTFLALLVFWAIASLLVATVRDSAV
ncbi:hypothetical protein BC374_15160 [Ensifer sp. LC13]|nr:hypothetical protein BC362_08285 [Ensifer sp. LC14]OCP12174.1 hypothetical protein BC374_15160 [Ensifer sp. LC13]OCP12992.1 hypothetical protein BBX50_14935 [Ensifer sp. LC11]OCP33736.1 hypothetical protein BC364_14250 [Ensifer sp. LC499]